MQSIFSSNTCNICLLLDQMVSHQIGLSSHSSVVTKLGLLQLWRCVHHVTSAVCCRLAVIIDSIGLVEGVSTPDSCSLSATPELHVVFAMQQVKLVFEYRSWSLIHRSNMYMYMYRIFVRLFFNVPCHSCHLDRRCFTVTYFPDI